MAKKSFKGGLDNLLASAGIKKRSEIKETAQKKPDVKDSPSDDEEHWLRMKIERLKDELKLWRTGKLSVEKFNNSLKESGLVYDAESNEISELK
jgi:hypothetical protein